MITKKTKNNLILWSKRIALYAFIAAGAIFIFNQVRPAKVVKSASIREYVPTNVYIDKEGIKRSEFQALELTNRQLKEETKELRKQLKGRHKIESVTSYTVGIDTNLTELPANNDSVKEVYTIGHNDPYLNAYAKINIKTEIGEIGIKLNDTIIDIRSRKGGFLFFSRGKETITLSSKGGYMNFFAGNSIVVKEPRTLIVVSAGASYNPFTNKFNPSINIGVPILQIKTKNK